MRKPYVSLSDHRAVMVCRMGKSDRIGGSLGKELVTEEKLRGRGHIRERMAVAGDRHALMEAIVT